jgi:D-3-phosphoglycerate dehydrogenase / 2-oxoglutarate reductase
VTGRRLRILVAGDSFCPSSAVTDEPEWKPRTPSELRLRELQGTPEQMIAALDDHEVLVMQGAPVTDTVLDASPSLRLVCCVRGGPVNVDVTAASERGIAVTTTPGKNADAVAELTIAFMIMLARRLPEVIRHVEGGGEFGHDNYEGARWFGHDLAGHTMGLVGFGQIGGRVASRALALGMRIVVSDPFVDPATIRAGGAEPVDLPTLLGLADFVSLHARATADNRGFIGAAQIAAMKPGSCLINTARDTLVDEAAIVAALASGHLAGLAVDLVSPSPATGRHPLLAFPNVIITTHIGGATYETLHHGGEMAAAEIRRYLAGEPLRYVANRDALAARADTSAVATAAT